MPNFSNQQLQALFAGTLAFEQQKALITELTQHMHSEQVLYQLAESARHYENLITGLPVGTIDIAGTGGDGANTLNFSTLAALLVAASGHPVAKHGNRASTSKCGSFDLIQYFSIEIPKTPEQAKHLIEKQGLAFLFAPYYHPAFKHVIAVRKWFAEQGQRTVFNVLGALLNPAHLSYMLVGVYDPKLLMPFAKTLHLLGVEYAYVVHGNGLDEATLTGQTDYIRLCQGQYHRGVWQPSDFGLPSCSLADIQGGAPEQNFAESQAILTGQLQGPKRDMVVLNAALALHVAGQFSTEIDQEIAKIEHVIDSKAAVDFLHYYSLRS